VAFWKEDLALSLKDFDFFFAKNLEYFVECFGIHHVCGL
jgi:hypothetical protein